MAYELVVVGTSWGGLRAVSALLAVLPDELEAAVAVVQHRGPERERGLYVGLLQRQTGRRVVDVSDKDPVERGHVYVAPPDYHLLVEPGFFSLSTEDRVMYSRPSIDVCFESAAESYGARAIGIVLTGANADGAVGLEQIRQAGGVAIVQDPETAEMPTMPNAALAAGSPDAVLSIAAMGPFLRELVVEPESAHA